MVLWFALLLFSVGDDPATTTPAAPAPPVIDPAPAAAPAALDPKQIICVKEAQAGTLFTRKVCHTREEWKRLREAQRRDADKVLDTDSNRMRHE